MVEAPAAFLANHHGFTELQAHAFVGGDHVGLDGHHHIFLEGEVRAFMTAAPGGLDDRRRLADPMKEVVINGITPIVNQISFLLDLAAGDPLLYEIGQCLERLHGDGVKVGPFLVRPPAQGIGPVDLTAIAPIGAADFCDQDISLAQSAVGLVLGGNRKVRCVHGHGGHEMDAGIAALVQVDRLDQRRNFPFPHADF